ncbi:nitrite reductase [Solicola sp. PLA-1-18]|uniref:nitrite reductase n=1 Tax=Solicola sp. PLA-1-18 TaxID=3380532 RepID=UPI003B800069
MLRTRTDRCPGVLRPWPADDGALVRLRLPGGRLSVAQLEALAELAEVHADGYLHLTSRANVQLRGVHTDDDGAPVATFVDALRDAGLLPSPAHDLVRNLACSPLTGYRGGLVDLRHTLADLDARLLATPALAGLPGKFLLALDDGRLDVAVDGADLTAVVLDATTARVVVGDLDAGTVRLTAVVETLVGLAHAFLAARGDGDDAPWHVAELPERGRELVGDRPAWDRPAGRDPVETGLHPQDDGGHYLCLGVPGAALTSDAARRVASVAGVEVVLTPDRGLVLPSLPEPETARDALEDLR